MFRKRYRTRRPKPAPEPQRGPVICPQCSGTLEVVAYPGGMLNFEQWSANRAGDYVCRKCPDNGRAASKQHAYFWAREAVYTEPQKPAPTAPQQTAREDFYSTQKEGWPHPDYVEQIKFEGCDVLAIAPEDYRCLYNKALELADRADAAEERARKAEENLDQATLLFDARITDIRTELAQARERIKELETIVLETYKLLYPTFDHDEGIFGLHKAVNALILERDALKQESGYDQD
jgi:hypothetical protein